MKLQEEKIQAFWNWFVKNEKTIKTCIENESATEQAYVVDQMNNLILDLGMLTWDLGLDDMNIWFLTISPNGDKELFEISQRIMDEAPMHLDWVFHSSKPAKDWDRTFIVFNEFMDEIEIDASDWQYVALEETDRKLKLILEAPNLQGLDEDTAESAAHKFLVHEIGEKAKILRISTIEIVHELESGFMQSKSPIQELKKHIR